MKPINRFGAVKTFFEKMFFSTRYVLLIHLESQEILKVDHDNLNISFERVEKSNFLDLKNILPKKSFDGYLKELEKRIENPEIWQGYLARHGDVPVGTVWLLIPKNKKVLQDHFWFDTHSIYACGAHVISSYRGKGIARMMVEFFVNVSKTELPDRTIIVLIDKINISSLKTYIRLNINITGNNYLIKLFGRNVISIYKPRQGSPKIWMVFSDLLH